MRKLFMFWLKFELTENLCIYLLFPVAFIIRKLLIKSVIISTLMSRYSKSRGARRMRKGKRVMEIL